jgi:hypothetical protein
MTFNFNTPQKSKIPAPIRQEIAIRSIRKEQPIKSLANEFGCSRTTVYAQQKIALNAVEQAFSPQNDDDKVMFYLPISKNILRTLVAILHVTCRSTYRHIIEFFRDFLGLDISIGNVFNIINEAAINAGDINKSEDFSFVRTGSSDEVFHRNQPIMATVDIPSRYCLQADLCDARDGETWAINLLYMKDQGYNPDSVIVDSAKGMTNGYKEALPNTKIRYDHFHILKAIKEVARFLRNKVQSSLTTAEKSHAKRALAKTDTSKAKFSSQFDQDFTVYQQLTEISQQFTILANWLQYDVLQLTGYNYEQRAELFDFIFVELTKLGQLYPHRIKKLLKSLKFQRDRLLDVANSLNDKFQELSNKYKIYLSDIWSICYLARYDYESVKYQQGSSTLEDKIGYETYDRIEDQVLSILESTPRCSSIVENFNSRLATFISDNKTITQKMLDLYRFFLNHSPFMRSEHKHLQGKSPAEAMTGTTHEVWYKMLGFQQPKLIAA